MTTRLWAAAALALAVGASRAQAEQYPVTGMVMKIDRARSVFVVSHDSIPGLMGPMMMPFPVKDPAELAALEPGTNVEFTLVVGKDASYATDVHVRRYESVEQDPLTARRLALLKRLSSTAAPAVVPLAPGEIVPDFTLIDQARRRVTLGRLRGKLVAVTFVYTSCALPQFCLRTASNFALLQRRFKQKLGRDLVLLTITFDPARDRPDVLARYAAQWHADAARWHFLTGPTEDVRRVTNLFGVDFFPDEGLLDHSVRTAFVGRDGRLIANIEGNQFSADQLANLVQTLLEP